MRYTLLGDSGLRVSEICLGTMTFGTDWGWGADEDTCRQQFELFTEAGGNFIDTANKYTDGSAEAIVGRLVAGRRDSFVLATKYSLNTRTGDLNAGGNHRKNLAQAIEASLRRLGTDYVDLLWLHAWDYLTPVEEIVRALDDQVRAGKVHYIGVSTHRLGSSHTCIRSRGCAVGPRSSGCRFRTPWCSATWSGNCSRWHAERAWASQPGLPSAAEYSPASTTSPPTADPAGCPASMA